MYCQEDADKWCSRCTICAATKVLNTQLNPREVVRHRLDIASDRMKALTRVNHMLFYEEDLVTSSFNGLLKIEGTKN